MNIIVCLDDKNGMLFNGRRQSSDHVVCQRMIEHIKDNSLWMNSYSAKLFSGFSDRIIVSDTFLEQCSDKEWCFVENEELTPYLHKARQLLIYRWNRVYPRDVLFPDIELPKPFSIFEFAGSSHEMITEELYIL